ncbi:MAG: hypothetical protein ACI4SB_05550, partial [Acutalibacteraceae bacterium]
EEIRKNFADCPDYDFSEQIDKVLLFFIYNTIGDIFGTDSLSQRQKNEMAKGILQEKTVVELFKRLNIGKLAVSTKLKILTGCYAHPVLVPLVSAYMGRK